MKSLIFLFAFFCSSQHNFPPEDIVKVSEAIHAFSQNADNRNVEAMRGVLHDGFRAIVNQALGSKEIQIIDKTTYLALMTKKVIGGEKRTVTILSIDMEGNNAIVKTKR